MTLRGPNNQIVKHKSLKKLSEITGLSYNSMCSLSVGRRFRLNGWVRTTGKHKKKAERLFETHTLVNLETGEEVYIWKCVRKFAKERELMPQGLSALINGQRHSYKNWVTKSTYNILYRQTADN